MMAFLGCNRKREEVGSSHEKQLGMCAMDASVPMSTMAQYGQRLRCPHGSLR